MRRKMTILAEDAASEELLASLIHRYPKLKLVNSIPLIEDAKKEDASDHVRERTGRRRRRAPSQKSNSGRRHVQILFDCIKSHHPSGCSSLNLRRALEDDGIMETNSMKGRLSDLVNTKFIKRATDDTDVWFLDTRGLSEKSLPDPLIKI